MNRHVAALAGMAQRPERHIVGLMSGTSLDGLDVALCAVSGCGTSTQVRLRHFVTVPYTDDMREEIRKVFAKTHIDFVHLTLLNAWLGQLHANMVLDCLRQWGVSPTDIDLIASHGQTVMHAPKSRHGQAKFSNATLQIGDGDHVAVRTGIITVSDFRQKHIAAGGEGAPLALYGDHWLLGHSGQARLLLNIGGIANFTYLSADADPTKAMVTDTGPGNTLLDAVARTHNPPMPFDQDAALAKAGQVQPALLAQLKAHPFFTEPTPKTTGPELFNLAYLHAAQAATHTTELGMCDLMATLTRFSAETIAQAVQSVGEQARWHGLHIYASGGGAHNPLLMAWLQELLPYPFARTDALGVPGDAKEAVLFALLANECVAGGDSHFGQGMPSVSMGKISFPS